MNFNKPTISISLIIRLVLLILWGVGCYIFFQTNFHYHFFHQEQNQLFLFSWDYIQTYFDKPAWLACLTGDFLTQFYYYLYAGPAILAIVCLIFGHFLFYSLMRLTSKTDKNHAKIGWIFFIAALIAMTLEARAAALGSTSNLSSIIALTGGCVVWYLFDIVRTSIINKSSHPLILSFVCLIILITLTYWAFGIGTRFTFIIFEIAKAAVVAAQGVKNGAMKNGLKSLGCSLVSALFFFILIVFAAPHYYLDYSDALDYPGLGEWSDYGNEKKLENCYALDNEYYLGHYQKVKNMYESFQGEKIDEMTFYYCLSLEQLGMLPSCLPEIKNPMLGTFLKITEDTPRYTIGMINDLYFLLGDMTYTERAALLANTFSPKGRNARMTKRLAEANLINGDIPAAMKYLRMLRQTLVYKQWAIDHIPETMTSEVKAEIARKHQFINTSDNIRVGDDCYVIMTQLLTSNPKNEVALDYLLCSDMLSHQADVFVRDYEKFGPSNKGIFADAYQGAKSATNNNQE